MPEETALATRIPLELDSTTPQSSQLKRLAAFTPVNLTEAIALSKLIAASDLAPKDYRGKPGNVLIGIQYAAELGIAPLTGLQNISIINGRAAVWGDLALALVQSHPEYEGHKEFFEGSGDTRTAVFQIKRKGQEWHQQKFSVSDAKTALLWGKAGPWKTNPDRMLQMRARGFGLRDKFADALKGLRLAEEAIDLPPEGKGRETGTLDVNREITSMTASSEPNRGHGNEGMSSQPKLSSGPDIDQTAKKQEDVICADCRQVNGHTKDCIHNQPCPECHAPAGKPHASKCSKKNGSTQEEPRAEKQTEKKLVKILSTKEVKKKNASGVYLICAVTDAEGLDWEFSSWDTKHHQYLKEAVGANAVIEVSYKTTGDRKFTNLEHVISIGAQDFVNDQPAEQGELSEEQF